MTIAREELIKLSAPTGFQPNMLEKVIYLLRLLDGFKEHPFLRNRFALKGGTALNLFIFYLPRLSVDLDLNYIGSVDRETMLSERPKIEKAIEAVCGRLGLTIERTSVEHAGGKWHLRFESALGGVSGLDLDLNYMFRIPLWDVKYRDSFPVGPYSASQIPILEEHELAAGKICALFARHASRDLFDVHKILSEMHFDKEKLRVAFIVYGAMNRVDWRTISLDNISFDLNDIINTLKPVLRTGYFDKIGIPLNWATAIVQECRLALNIILPFNEKEMEFLDNLLNNGEIVPSLITDDPEVSERILKYPGLLWKAQNVRQFKGINKNDEMEV